MVLAVFLDDFPVAGDDVAGFADHHIAGPQPRSRDEFDLSPSGEKFGRRIRLGFAERVRLSLAPGFRHRLGKVGEKHREPKPQIDLELESQAVGADDRVTNQKDRRQRRAHFDHKHHGVFE